MSGVLFAKNYSTDSVTLSMDKGARLCYSDIKILTLSVLAA